MVGHPQFIVVFQGACLDSESEQLPSYEVMQMMLLITRYDYNVVNHKGLSRPWFRERPVSVSEARCGVKTGDGGGSCQRRFSIRVAKRLY
jgi:hypothetical protein